MREIAGRPALKVHDEVLPFASIDALLGLGPERAARPRASWCCWCARRAPPRPSRSTGCSRSGSSRSCRSRACSSRYPHLTGATPLADGSLAMVLSAGAPDRRRPRHREAADLRRPPPKAEVRRRRILVVDDSPLTRELLASLLEAVGYEILTAADGAEALERLGRESVDIVVTDLEMPRMDGLELTRRVKAHPTWRALPVVIVTTRGGEADRQRGNGGGRRRLHRQGRPRPAGPGRRGLAAFGVKRSARGGVTVPAQLTGVEREHGQESRSAGGRRLADLSAADLRRAGEGPRARGGRRPPPTARRRSPRPSRSSRTSSPWTSTCR